MRKAINLSTGKEYQLIKVVLRECHTDGDPKYPPPYRYIYLKLIDNNSVIDTGFFVDKNQRKWLLDIDKERKIF